MNKNKAYIFSIDLSRFKLSLLLTAVFLFSPWGWSASLCVQLFKPSALSQQSQGTIYETLFESNEPLHLKVRGPFEKIVKNSQNETRRHRTQQSFSGELQVENQNGKITTLDVHAKAYGDSSLNSDEATFPKLNLTWQEEGLVQSLYIGTHFQTHPQEKWTPQGRITDGTSPYREALVYDLARVLNIKTGGYRRANIEYKDTETGEVLHRQALLMEDHAAATKKWGGKMASEKDFYKAKNNFPLKAPLVNVAEATRMFLFQILIGNTDFKLEILNTRTSPSLYYMDLKNVALFKDQKGELHPVAYDFDVASIVAGYEVSEVGKPWSVIPEWHSNSAVVVMAKRILELRTKVSEQVLLQEISFARSRLSELRKKIKMAKVNQFVDTVGSQLAEQHVLDFEKALDLAWDSRIQFVQSQGIKFYETPQKRKNLLKYFEVEDRSGDLRLGTPVLKLGEENGMIKLLVIDIQNDLSDPTSYIGYVNPKIKLREDLNPKEIPYFDARSLFY